MVGTVVRISTEWQAIELSADDLLPLGDIDTASHPQVVPAVASDNSGDFKESLVPFSSNGLFTAVNRTRGRLQVTLCIPVLP